MRTFSLDSKFVQTVKRRYERALPKRNGGNLDDDHYCNKGDHRDALDCATRSDLPLRTLTTKTIRTLIEGCFWASLGKEEGCPVDFCLVASPPVFDVESLVFKNSLSFGPDRLVKLAPAIDASQAVIGVWYTDNGRELGIWGFASPKEDKWFSLKSYGPGLLMLRLPIRERSLWRPRALVTGSAAFFLDASWDTLGSSEPFSRARRVRSITRGADPSMRSAFFGFDSYHVLRRVTEHVWRHGRGGTLLVIPRDTDEWKKSFAQPISYAPKHVPHSPFEKKRKNRSEGTRQTAQVADPLVRQAVDSLVREAEIKEYMLLIAKLTAVDGATVVTQDGDILAFGAKIKAVDSKDRDSNDRLEEVFVSDPFEGTKDRRTKVAELGGTRHQSAAQFVFAQRHSTAIVVSQDGKVSVMSWDGELGRLSVTRNAQYIFP